MTRGEENAALLQRIAEGDRQAENELVKANAGLVAAIVRRFEGRGAETEDLMQLGYVGLIKAARGFDASRGTMFSTYAVPYVAGEIRQSLRDDGLIRVSREVRRRAARITRIKERYIAEHGREPHFSELCALCGMTKEEALEALGAAEAVVSLDEPTNEDGTPRGELYADVNGTDAVKSMIIKEAFRSLEGKERAILLLRAVCGMTQTEIAQRLGMTQTTVSRTEKRAKEKVRAMVYE